eukprot:SAG31_NODE_16678_length_700_cov_1.094842_1_plen_82_part_00
MVPGIKFSMLDNPSRLAEGRDARARDAHHLNLRVSPPDRPGQALNLVSVQNPAAPARIFSYRATRGELGVGEAEKWWLIFG